ncbi:Cytochrome c-type biogenesis protein CcmE2C heme chaperone [gamma proteobacterium IMCC2047]|nr:Cytochrome c-type biogenesis protein CcmE2C heme chaperone [gamma proteobacterium IMCC2047]
MHPIRRQRLFIVLFVVSGISLAVGLGLFALQENINLFYSPTQIVEGEAPDGQLIRAGGMVVDGSVKRDTDSLKVEFQITDYAETVTVEYEGILPDLFREGQGIVTQGRMAGDRLMAVEVLAKHDENYMSPEVAEALEKAGVDPQQHGKPAADY